MTLLGNRKKGQTTSRDLGGREKKHTKQRKSETVFKNFTVNWTFACGTYCVTVSSKANGGRRKVVVLLNGKRHCMITVGSVCVKQSHERDSYYFIYLNVTYRVVF